MTPVQASTVILLRDVDEGVETFMLERHLDSDFVGGAYVFPGGKVDEEDCRLPPDLWTGIDPVTEAPRFGVEPAMALGLYVAAARETLEEAGVLLGSVPSRTADRPGHEDSLEEWLRDHGAVLDLGTLAPWSWWVTPEGVHRRFDTKFFAAVAPSDQRARHDGAETVDSMWVRPADAIARARAGEVMIILPTRRNLLAIDGGSAQEIVRASRARFPERIEPQVRPDPVSGEMRIFHPSFEGPEEF